MVHRILRRCALVSCVLIVFFTLHVSIWTATSPSEQKTSLLWSFAAITGADVTRDGTVITSRSVGTAMDFALELVEILAGRETRQSVESAMERNSNPDR